MKVINFGTTYSGPSADRQRQVLGMVHAHNNILNLIQDRQFQGIDDERYNRFLKNLEIMVINQRSEMKNWLRIK